MANERTLEEAIEAYARRFTPIKILRGLNPEIRERLRALGYAED